MALLVAPPLWPLFSCRSVFMRLTQRFLLVLHSPLKLTRRMPNLRSNSQDVSLSNHQAVPYASSMSGLRPLFSTKENVKSISSTFWLKLTRRLFFEQKMCIIWNFRGKTLQLAADCRGVR